MTKDNVIQAIHRHENDIKAYGVRKVGVFGSFARSSQTAKSDIDVLVEFDKNNKTFDNYMDLKFYLEKLLGRKVDLVIKDALKERIKTKILSEVEYA